MKIGKKGEIRKNEILDIAENLFVAKSYENTTINDILEAAQIAKGALYYYFTSKEEILDEIIKRHGDRSIELAKEIMATKGMLAPEKFLRVMMAQKPQDNHKKSLVEDLQKTSNSQMFLKSLTGIILRLAPLVGEIIKQGVKEGFFSTTYPLECAETILVTAHCVFDNGGLQLTPEEELGKLLALIANAEKMLGAKEGSLQNFVVLLQ